VQTCNGAEFIKLLRCRIHFQTRTGPIKPISIGQAPSSPTIRSLLRAPPPACKVGQKMDLSKSQVDELLYHPNIRVHWQDNIVCIRSFRQLAILPTRKNSSLYGKDRWKLA
jgi:hypothetical protein